MKVGNIDHRWKPTSFPIYVDVSIQVQVTNTCGRSERMLFRVEMLDLDGFLLEATGNEIATVRPSSDTVRIKHTMMLKFLADQVARFEVVVES